MGLFDWWVSDIDVRIENNVRRGFFTGFGWPFRDTEGSRRARAIDTGMRQYLAVRYLQKQTDATVEDILREAFEWSPDERRKSLTQLLQGLEKEGWVESFEKQSHTYWRYIPGEGDSQWGYGQDYEDLQKENIYRMCNGLLSRDQAILDYLRAHKGEHFLVRELLARVFGEEEKVTSKMVRDSLEWLTEKELATVGEDENGRLLFRAAPEAEAHAQTQE